MYHSQLEFSPHDFNNLLTSVLIAPGQHSVYRNLGLPKCNSEEPQSSSFLAPRRRIISPHLSDSKSSPRVPDEFLYFPHPPPRQSLTESWLLQDTTWRRRISGMSTSCGLRPTQKMHEGLSLGGSQGVRPVRPSLRKCTRLGPFKPRRAGGYVTTAHA